MKDQHSSPIAYAIVFQCALGFIALLFALVVGRFTLPSSITIWPRFIVSAILWAGATVFGFFAIKKLSAGEVTILNTASVLVSIFLSIVFLKERMTWKVLVGTASIFVGIWIVNTDTLSFGSKQGIFFALLSAIPLAHEFVRV